MEDENEEKDDKLYFRTNVLLKSIIGKDLITDDHIAVLELVKNSFDAMSKEVTIEFLNILEGKKEAISTLLIQDSGKGMDITDVRKKWLNIAYSEKKTQKEISGRTLAGNKGVGRFSCDRLGRRLDIYTKTAKENEVLHLEIDWQRFEIEDNIDLQIQDIKIDHDFLKVRDFEKETGLRISKSGTILKITELRREWDRDKLIRLRKNLEKLINPNQAFKKDRFEVTISVPEFKEEDKKYTQHERVNGLVENKVFETLQFKSTSIVSELSEDGETITTVLQDAGREIFTLVEKNNSFKTLSNTKIVLYYLNPYSKAYFKRQTGVRSVDFGSIFLFINGFRIPPYGDEGDDWLGIELRKGQGYSRFLGTREILGRIEVQDDQDKFQIISSRSGVVNTKVFMELTNMEAPHGYFYKTFRRLERFVTEGIKWDSVPKELEKKIEKAIEENKNWTEKLEVYREDRIVRDKRVLSSILKIINVNTDDLIDLKIDEDFVNELIRRQTEAIETGVQEALNKVKEEDLTSTQINSILKTLEEKKKELSSFSSSIDKNLSHIGNGDRKELLGNMSSQSLIIDDRLEELKKLEDELLASEKEKKRLKDQLELEKEKNTYLKASSRSLSEDAKGLVHNIKITAKNIGSNVNSLIEKINAREIKEKEILRRLGVIKFNSEKALKISRLITRSNFKTQANTQIIDLVKYIEQYVTIYSDIYETEQIEFELVKDGDPEFERRVSILDLSLVLDDLISNSIKAEASKIRITISGDLEILFSDNGKGVDSKFLDNPEAMFELGITTTHGSGIGLNSVKKALSSMKGKIQFIGNGAPLSGATFKIVFS